MKYLVVGVLVADEQKVTLRKLCNVLNKIVRLCIVFLLCITILPGCGSRRAVEQSRVERLEFELYKITSRLERVDSKIDMLNWSVSQPLGLGRMSLETDARQEQLEKLVVDLKAQVSRLNEQLSNSESHS